MVLMAGLEPARYRYRGILSPLCLPIPPHQRIYIDGDIVPHEANKINREHESLILEITRTGFGQGFVIKYKGIKLA